MKIASTVRGVRNPKWYIHLISFQREYQLILKLAQVRNDVPYLSNSLVQIFFVCVSCSTTWEMAQTMTSLTRKIADKTSLCLVNHAANMSDDPGYSLHTHSMVCDDQAGLIIRMYHWKSAPSVKITVRIQINVMLTELRRKCMPGILPFS